MRRLILSLVAALAFWAPAAGQTPARVPAPAAQPRPAAGSAARAPGPAMIYSIEQIVSTTLNPELMEKIKPMHSLREVEDLLKANSIQFGWRRQEVDSSTLNPALVAEIEALPPGEVSVVPQGQNLAYNVILTKRPKPGG